MLSIEYSCIYSWRLAHLPGVFRALAALVKVGALKKGKAAATSSLRTGQATAGRGRLRTGPEDEGGWLCCMGITVATLV